MLLADEPAVAQRLVCAKRTLHERRAVLEVPGPEELRARLPGRVGSEGTFIPLAARAPGAVALGRARGPGAALAALAPLRSEPSWVRHPWRFAVEGGAVFPQPYRVLRGL